jgi:hypothetical protein
MNFLYFILAGGIPAFPFGCQKASTKEQAAEPVKSRRRELATALTDEQAETTAEAKSIENKYEF